MFSTTLTIIMEQLSSPSYLFEPGLQRATVWMSNSFVLVMLTLREQQGCEAPVDVV